MTTKSRTIYVCQQCGRQTPRWAGRCPHCREWNTLVEEIQTRRRPQSPGKQNDPLPLGHIDLAPSARRATGISELDRVLGGGLVPGSVILLGGDPGIGKSTLTMQVAASLAPAATLYVTGEESPQQLRMRAERLSLDVSDSLYVFTEPNVEMIDAAVRRSSPELLVIDSIQTMEHPGLEGSPGSVAQVREAAARITRLCKELSLPVFLIGHVTKDGFIAGPKVIEHMVDTVLHFEGDSHFNFRVLRAIKNRFGSTNEIGVFEMGPAGLSEVSNPSELLLSERSPGASGSTVVAGIEGSRSLLMEVQALVSPAGGSMPQRSTTGVDPKRLGQIVAVIEKRLGVALSRQDIFVNVAGGIRADEPAIDLGIALSLLSSLRDVPLPAGTVAVGEVGLGGEIRSVGQIGKRVGEAGKLGFERIILPKNNARGISHPGIRIHGVESIAEAAEILKY